MDPAPTAGVGTPRGSRYVETADEQVILAVCGDPSRIPGTETNSLRSGSSKSMNIGVGILLWVPGTLKLRQGASLPSLHLGGVPGTLKTAQDEAKPSRQQTSGTLETSHPLGGDEAGTLKNVKRTRYFPGK